MGYNKEIIVVHSILSIFFLKIAYVFLMTDYPSYLTSDAAGYWVRAHDRFEGKELLTDQWNVFPPFYHIAISGVFAVLDSMSLLHKSVEAIVLIHIFLSTLSTYSLYLIVNIISPNRFYSSLTTLIIYGLFYPITYLNAFVLSENLSIPIFIFAIYFLFQRNCTSLILSAIFLAISAATRSNMIIFFFPFFLYLILRSKDYLLIIKETMSFISAFSLAIGLVIAENYRISNGKLIGLSSNGGLNLAIAFCRYRTVESKSEQGQYAFGVSAYGPHAEYRSLSSTVPFSNQSYYITMAKKCIKENPSIWIEKIKEIPNIFIGPMYPYYTSAKWIDTFLPFSKYLLLGLATFSLMFFWCKLKEKNSLEYVVILSVPLFSFFTLYIFNLDNRLIYQFSFSYIIISVVSFDFIKCTCISNYISYLRK